MKKNILLIINPRAGKTKGKAALFDIVDALSSDGSTVTVEITRSAGHARELAQTAGSRADTVVCVGGDGTLNEVIAGVISSEKHIPIGYIPAGSTNDFATTLNISKDMRRAALDVAEGVPRTIDIGQFGDRYFTYVASFGAFTKTSYSTPQDIKNALGHLAYILQGICDIPSIRAEHVTVTTAEREYSDDYIFGAIANSTSVGGIISFDERLVTMNDGKFEMLLVRRPKNLPELNRCINALLTQNYNCDMIDFGTLTAAEITTDNPLTWSLDGERADTDGKVKVTNLKNAVTMLLTHSISDAPILEGDVSN